MILSGSENYNYIFPMDTALAPHSRDKLQLLYPFLKNPEDTSFVSSLIACDIPCDFAVLNTNEGESFLCIATFPKGWALNSEEDTDLAPDLAPYKQLLQEAAPHLAALLYKGGQCREPFELPPPQEEYAGADHADYTDIVEKALSCEDIFVAFASDEVPGIFGAIVRRLLGQSPAYNPRYESFERYKKRLLSQHQPDYSLADRLEIVKINIEQYAFTYAGAIAALHEVYFIALAHVGQDVLAAFNKAISSLSIAPAAARGDSSKRLLRSVRAIPCNAISYEDNGASHIEEALIRLEPLKHMEADLSALKELAKNYDGSESWFSLLREIRERLLLSLHATRSPYISDSHKEMLLSVLDMAVLALQAAAEENAQNPFLQEYLAEIEPEALHKYINPVDGTRPFVHKGVALIDMNSCHDEAAIMKAVAAAERLIILGNSQSKLFHLFAKAAQSQSRQDNKIRIVNMLQETEEKPPLSFYWLYKKERRRPLAAHVQEMAAKGHSIGIWTEEKDIRQELADFGLDTALMKIGSLSELYQNNFDILYWTVSKETAGADMDIALNKAKQHLAIIGDPGDFPAGSPLRDIFDKCAGDDKHGRIYR